MNSAGMEPYAYYRIIDMISREGIDVASLGKFTGFSNDKLVQLLEYCNDEIIGLDPNVYFRNTKRDDKQGKEQGDSGKLLKCPVCGKLVSNAVSEWMVVQYEGEQEPVLTCKYCGGVYEENYI